jgi:hypothetical protein
MARLGHSIIQSWQRRSGSKVAQRMLGINHDLAQP